MTSGAAIVLSLAGAVFVGLMGWLLWRVEATQDSRRKDKGNGGSVFTFVGGDGGGDGGGSDCGGGGGSGGGDGGGGGG